MALGVLPKSLGPLRIWGGGSVLPTAEGSPESRVFGGHPGRKSPGLPGQRRGVTGHTLQIFLRASLVSLNLSGLRCGSQRPGLQEGRGSEGAQPPCSWEVGCGQKRQPPQAVRQVTRIVRDPPGTFGQNWAHWASPAAQHQSPTFTLFRPIRETSVTRTRVCGGGSLPSAFAQWPPPCGPCVPPHFPVTAMQYLMPTTDRTGPGGSRRQGLLPGWKDWARRTAGPGGPAGGEEQEGDGQPRPRPCPAGPAPTGTFGSPACGTTRASPSWACFGGVLHAAKWIFIDIY